MEPQTYTRQKLEADVHDLARALCLHHDLLPEEVVYRETFVDACGFYQSYEQLPAVYRINRKYGSIWVDATGITFNGDFYSWQDILFTGIISCKKHDPYNKHPVPVFPAVFIAATRHNGIISFEGISEMEFGSIVQIYKRRFLFLQQNPVLPAKEIPFLLRSAVPADLASITTLYRNTIYTVNAPDYPDLQLHTWAAGANHTEKWQKRLRKQLFLVTEDHSGITGFASLAANGCIDLLYVHKDHQRKGIASILVQALEQAAWQKGLSKVWADVSLTARPFFASKGYVVERDYLKFVNGVEFRNAIMAKTKRSGE